MTERQLDPKTVLNPKLWFAPPEGRRVLMQSIVEVRPKEPLEIHLDVFGAATGEAKRDERSLLLSVYWLDQNRSLLESLPKDFVKSAEYGNFKYLAYPAEDGSGRIMEALLAPPQCAFLVMRVLAFANWGLSLLHHTIRRSEMAPDAEVA